MNITSVVTLILALSVASERLIEILKGLIPWLDQKNSNAKWETRRRAILQFLAVVSGIVTAYLARDYLTTDPAKPIELWQIVELGLLASGGSGFWNSILDYLTGLKDLTNAQAKNAKSGPNPPPGGGPAPAVLPNPAA